MVKNSPRESQEIRELVFFKISQVGVIFLNLIIHRYQWNSVDVLSFFSNFHTLRILNPPMETPDPPFMTPRKGPQNHRDFDTP